MACVQKTKVFNAEIKTDLMTLLEKINVVPQDIGRVLLNLFNNAFYAVQKSYRQLTAERDYEAGLFQFKQKRLMTKLKYVVRDNGNGIPQNIIDKIFQPFFTTKPTGQGQVGLSLAYDIIKAHGGEIKVQTKKAKGSEFTIQLPNDDLSNEKKFNSNIFFIADARTLRNAQARLRR
jgi:signal transduction histidine kinase